MSNLWILLVGFSFYAANGAVLWGDLICSILNCGPDETNTTPVPFEAPSSTSSNTYSDGQDCGRQTELPFISLRKVGYILSASDIPVSDSKLIEGWYSILGYRLSTNSSEGCGVPINWYMLDTALPRLYEEINATVCINNGQACTNESSKTIRIKQCGPNNYLFRLPPTNTDSEGYCIVPVTNQDKDPAPIVDYIRPSIDVEIAPDKKHSYKRQLVYFCRFTIKPNDRNFIYTVTWFSVDSRGRFLILHSSSASADNSTVFEEETKLTEDHLRANEITQLGYSIMCAVMAQTSEIGHFSDPINSDVKFCGIQIVSDTLMIVRDEVEAIISLEMTVPFYCPSESCFLDVVLFIPSNQDSCEIPRLVSPRGSLRPCGARFNMSDVNKVINISVANMLGEHGLGQEFDVMLRTNFMKYQDMLSYYLLEPVQIYSFVNQWKLSGKRCYSHSDPHTKSFDQSNTFESIGAGVFVLYRNTKFNTEVHTIQAPCPNYSPVRDHPYCNTAVAIRAGRDVYVIDLTKYITGFVLCDDGVLAKRVRKRNSNVFQIFLPTGTEVHIVNSWYTFLEIDIYPGLHDHNNTEGLCGNFDGDAHNDAMKSGCLKGRDKCWQVEHTSGLFDEGYRASLSPWKEELTMCKCQCDLMKGCRFATEIVCSEELKSSCKMESYKDVFNGMCSKDRRKRDIHRSHEVMPDVKAAQAESNRGRTRRSETKIDLETARRLCAATMNTTCVQMCSAIPGLDIESYYDNCASDVEASNSMDWTQIHIEGIKQACIEHLELHKPIPLEVLATTAVIVENDISTDHASVSSLTPYDVEILIGNLQDVSCMNDCSGHGNCVHGACKCDTGFISDDCSIDSNAAPEIIGIPDRGLCDFSERLCEQTAIIGRNFVDSESLTCKLIPFKFHLDATIDQEYPITVKAQLDTFLQVICPLPAENRRRRSTSGLQTDICATGYTISISNDGHTYSVGDSIVLFDSTCMECRKDNEQISCTKKPGFCVLDGRCYAQGDAIGCYSCQGYSPEFLQWTTGSACVGSNGTTSKYWIIGLVIGVVGALAIVITTLYVTRCVCKKKNITEQAPAVLGPAKPIFRPVSTKSTHRIQLNVDFDRETTKQAWAFD